MSIFENDWIMRQIESMTDMLGKVLLHKDKTKIIEEDEFGDDKVRNYYHKSQELIKQKKYKEAITYIKENFSTGNMDYLKAVLSCFDQLNVLTEKELEEGNYSRQELYNDLEFITEQYGIHL
ncbi:MAG: DUF6483 family protein [Clostridium sp.]